MSDQLVRISTGFGYTFKNGSLLETALTHRSAQGANNERLEYLGDAILNFVIAEALYHALPRAPEGILTRLRASLVKRETLADIGRELQLGHVIRLGDGEKKSGGWRRDSILSNTVEALLGAIYLDSDLSACRAAILQIFSTRLQSLAEHNTGKDPKTTLQEILQARHLPLPAYRVVEEAGEAHDRLFRVECRVADLDTPVIAEGRSKRNAEQAAASLALERLGTRPR